MTRLDAKPGHLLRYRLRLLLEHPRFYTLTDTCNPTLERRGLASRSGRMDDRGRIEWAITEAGRAALAEERGDAAAGSPGRDD